jgi:serine/threonine protein kinase/tetratricopeptide (TPR) repeat protein
MLRAKSMSDPSPRRSDEQPAEDPTLSRQVESNPDTLPLNTTTKRDEKDVTSAALNTQDPHLAPTQIEPSFDASGFAPTVNLPTEFDRTVEFVQKEVRRKATAILHTKVGDYEIERELGRGGMGVVYKAHHRQLRRDVALKMILAGKHAGSDQLERFLTEARSVAQLQHPNIVQIFDIGEQDGLPYFSLEFVDGKSLAQVINKQPQDPQQAARIIEILGRAMQYAHDHRVLHRDLKPANVLLTHDSVPKISDFGLAKKVEDEETASTQTGTVMGTPSYMSPEQAMGLTHDVGPAADQYSLGAMLYEMLTGRPPFLAAKPVETILQVIHDEPVRPQQLQPGTPADIETICLKALQKDVSKRYGSCNELADDLRRFLNGEPILARPVSQLERAARWCRRNPWIAIPSSLAIVFLVLASIVSTWSYFTVKSQNVAIKIESDNAKRQEAHAKVQEGIAKERAEAATKQAKLVIDTVQVMLSEFDTKLSSLPASSETRLSLLETIVKVWDQIDKSVRDDEEGTAVPTLMVARHKIALLYIAAGKLDLADKEFQKLYDIAKHRIQVKKGADGARQNLAEICRNLGDIRQQIHRDMQKSREYFLESKSWYEDILENPKPDPKTGIGAKTYLVQSALANADQSLGVSYLRDGQLNQASPYFQQALKRREELAQSIKAHPQYLLEPDYFRKTFEDELNLALDKSYLTEGELNFRLERTAEAERINRILLEKRKSRFEAAPEEMTSKIEYARFCAHVGEFNLYMGRLDEGRPLLDEAVRLLHEVVQQDSKNSVSKEYLSAAHYRLGCLLDELGDLAAAQEQFQKCRDLREALTREAKDSQKWQSQLMLAKARCQDVPGAIQIAESLRDTAKPDTELLLERARALAQCSRVAPDVQSKSSGAETTAKHDQQTDLINRSFKALEAAVANGYRVPIKIRLEPDFKPLRDDPRFAAVLANAKPTP